jgi:hypothetical protein
MSASETRFKSLPKGLQVVLVVLVAAAVIIVCWSSWDVLHSSQGLFWIVLAALAVMTIPFALFLPTAEIMVSFGETFLMAIAMPYGPSHCVITAAFCALISIGLFGFLGPARKFFSVVINAFNFSGMVCDAFLYSTIYQLAKPTDTIGGMGMAAIIMALFSFLFNSLVTFMAISWRHGGFDLKQWVREYLPLSINTLLAAACALFIAATYRFSLMVPLAIAPVIGIMWAWTKAYKDRLMRKAALEECRIAQLPNLG